MRSSLLAVSPDEAARMSNLSRTTVYRLIRAGEIPMIKVGRRTLIMIEALEAFLKGRSQTRSPQGSSRAGAAPKKGEPCAGFRSPASSRKDRRRPRNS